jgi:hypothetical protein
MSYQRDGSGSQSADPSGGDRASVPVSKRDYEVGYGKPPAATQLKRGRSGNPKGRAKKKEVDDFRTVIEAILAEPVKLSEGGHVRVVSKLEAMLHAQRMKALKGDHKAIRALFKMAQRSGQLSRADPGGLLVLTPAGNEEEKKILRVFHSKKQGFKGSGGPDVGVVSEGPSTGPPRIG